MAHLELFGLNDRWRALFESRNVQDERLARVIRQDRGYAQLVTEDGECQLEVKPELTGPVIVGDWVAIDAERVRAVLPRSSLLSRRDAYNDAEQPVAANIEIVFVVCGADRPRKAGRIERAVTQAWEAGARPVVVLTKLDVLDDPASELDAISKAVPTVEVIGVSSLEGSGIDELRKEIAGHTVVLIGESGAGKSTLLNALASEELAQMGRVRSGDSKGRHTTTRRELYVLEGGGIVIDTPGVRSLGLWADVGAVDATFSDISEIAENCRFSDCGHETEPGCAVKAAVESGEISAERVESWLELRKEAAAAELRRSEHEKRQAERRFSRVVDAAVKRKKRN